jgi:hypothetical protein
MTLHIIYFTQLLWYRAIWLYNRWIMQLVMLLTKTELNHPIERKCIQHRRKMNENEKDYQSDGVRKGLRLWISDIDL